MKELNAALAGGFDPKRQKVQKLQTALNAYVDWRETEGRSSIRKARHGAKALVASLGDIPLNKVSPFALERFKWDRQEKGAAPATVNRDLALFKHFCTMAARWGWLTDAHAEQIKAVKLLKEPPGRVRYLTPEEESRLLAELRPPMLRVVCGALLTGTRQAELVGLKKDAVDMSARVIILTRTKSNKVRRVPFGDAAAKVLEEAMAASPCEYVFVSSRGEPYTADGLRAIFRRAVRRAEIPNFRYHDLRHTLATRLRRSGTDLDALQQILGQSTLAMVMRYAHIGEDTVREAMASLPAPRLPEAKPSGKGEAKRRQFRQNDAHQCSPVQQS